LFEVRGGGVGLCDIGKRSGIRDLESDTVEEEEANRNGAGDGTDLTEGEGMCTLGDGGIGEGFLVVGIGGGWLLLSL